MAVLYYNSNAIDPGDGSEASPFNSINDLLITEDTTIYLMLGCLFDKSWTFTFDGDYSLTIDFYSNASTTESDMPTIFVEGDAYVLSFVPADDQVPVNYSKISVSNVYLYGWSVSPFSVDRASITTNNVVTIDTSEYKTGWKNITLNLI